MKTAYEISRTEEEERIKKLFEKGFIGLPLSADEQREFIDYELSLPILLLCEHLKATEYHLSSGECPEARIPVYRQRLVTMRKAIEVLKSVA